MRSYRKRLWPDSPTCRSEVRNSSLLYTSLVSLMRELSFHETREGERKRCSKACAAHECDRLTFIAVVEQCGMIALLRSGLTRPATVIAAPLTASVAGLLIPRWISTILYGPEGREIPITGWKHTSIAIHYPRFWVYWRWKYLTVHGAWNRNRYYYILLRGKNATNRIRIEFVIDFKDRDCMGDTLDVNHLRVDLLEWRAYSFIVIGMKHY